jgi:hypothetical protein
MSLSTRYEIADVAAQRHHADVAPSFGHADG